jgi:hypothetical protein
VCLSATLVLAACAAQTRPLSIADALGNLQRELKRAGAVSATGATPEQFAAAARAAQCAAAQADPEIPLLAHDVSVDLSGSFTATGGFAVGTIAAAFGGNASASRSDTQELVLPVSFTALSGLPDVVAAQRLALAAALPEAPRQQEAARILRDRDALRSRIDGLIAGFSPATCPTKNPPAAPPFLPSSRAPR